MFQEQMILHEFGFKTYHAKVRELAQRHGLHLNYNLAKSDIKTIYIYIVIELFKRKRSNTLRNAVGSPLFRTYVPFKCDFKIEPILL